MRISHLVLLIIINAIWGTNFVAAGLALTGFPPIMANMLRFVIVSVILAPFLRIIPGRMSLILASALIFGVMHFGSNLLAIKLIGDVSIVAISSQLSVPFSTLLAIIVLREHVGWHGLTGMVVAFFGAAIIAFDPRALDHLDGFALAVFGAMSFSVASVMLRRLADAPTLTLQAWIALAAATGSFALSLVLESGQSEALETAPTIAWAAVAFSALLSSLIGHVGMTFLLRHNDLAVISPYFLLMPVFALLASHLILGENLTGLMWLGTSLTLSGVGYITLRNRNGRPATPPMTSAAKETA